MTTPKNMVIGEVKALLHRWGEESDLNDEELLECIDIAVAEYYDEEVVDFESDITLDEDE
mgnify:FL=1|tara:strand:+ start:127 stop:306 length:180 start_codon:yes stop_codon:yes gene_type:complete